MLHKIVGWCLLALLTCWSCVYANHDALRVDPFSTLPDSNLATFRTNSRNFWEHEQAQVDGRAHNPFIYSGGLHGTSATLTSPIFATEAFTPERVNQTGTAITYAAVATDTCWTIISSDNNGITGWTRVGTTSYYYQCEGDGIPNQPTLPANSAWLMQITVTGSAITRVDRLSTPNPIPLERATRIVNLWDYGARGAGEDATTAFELALAALNTSVGLEPTSNQPLLSGKLIVPRGVYIISRAITVPKDISIECPIGGPGSQEDVARGAVLLSTTTGTIFYLLNSNEIRGCNFQNYLSPVAGVAITIQDVVGGITLAGGIGIFNNTFQGGCESIRITGFGRVHIRYNSFTTVGAANCRAIHIGANMTSATLSNIHINENNFNIDSQPSPTGASNIIHLGGVSVRLAASSITKNWFQNFRTANTQAVQLGASHTTTIENNIFDTINGIGSSALYSSGGHTLNVRNNFFNSITIPINWLSVTNSEIGPNYFTTITGNWIALDAGSVLNVLYLPSGGTFSITAPNDNWIFGADSLGGRLTRPNVRVTKSANQTIVPGTPIALTWDVETFDTANLHSTTTNNTRLTASRTGKWLVMASVGWATETAGYRQVMIRANFGGGTDYAFAAVPMDANTDRITLNVTALVNLNSDEFVEIVVIHDSGADRTVTSASSSAAMVYIGE